MNSSTKKAVIILVASVSLTISVSATDFDIDGGLEIDGDEIKDESEDRQIHVNPDDNLMLGNEEENIDVKLDGVALENIGTNEVEFDEDGNLIMEDQEIESLSQITGVNDQSITMNSNEVVVSSNDEITLDSAQLTMQGDTEVDGLLEVRENIDLDTNDLIDASTVEAELLDVESADHTQAEFYRSADQSNVAIEMGGEAFSQPIRFGLTERDGNSWFSVADNTNNLNDGMQLGVDTETGDVSVDEGSLDVNQDVEVGGNLDMVSQDDEIRNFFDSHCPTGEALVDVTDSGDFLCMDVADEVASDFVNRSGDTMTGDLEMIEDADIVMNENDLVNAGEITADTGYFNGDVIVSSDGAFQFSGGDSNFELERPDGTSDAKLSAWGDIDLVSESYGGSVLSATSNGDVSISRNLDVGQTVTVDQDVSAGGTVSGNTLETDSGTVTSDSPMCIGDEC